MCKKSAKHIYSVYSVTIRIWLMQDIFRQSSRPWIVNMSAKSLSYRALGIVIIFWVVPKTIIVIFLLPIAGCLTLKS